MGWFQKIKTALLAHELLWIWGAASFLLSITGPFGTYEGMPFSARIVYWPGLIAVSILLAIGLLRGLAPLLQTTPFLVAELLRLILFSGLFSVVVRGATGALANRDPLSVWSQGELFATIFAVACGVSVFYWLWVGIRAPVALVSVADPTPLPRLQARLPNDAAAPVMRLSVDDHYVEAHLTDGRSFRLLMRFADAIGEMDGVPGICTHRSHWVTTDAIARHFRQSGRDFLQLHNGAEIPVSRTYRPALIRAGVIQS